MYTSAALQDEHDSFRLSSVAAELQVRPHSTPGLQAGSGFLSCLLTTRMGRASPSLLQGIRGSCTESLGCTGQFYQGPMAEACALHTWNIHVSYVLYRTWHECINSYLQTFICLEIGKSFRSWHEKERVISCCQIKLHGKPLLSPLHQVWLCFLGTR